MAPDGKARPTLPTQLPPLDDDSDLSDLDDNAAPAPQPDPQAPDPLTAPRVRPIQVGEWLRNVITTRIMDSDHEATTRKLLQSRQWGAGVSRGAEAIAMFT